MHYLRNREFLEKINFKRKKARQNSNSQEASILTAEVEVDTQNESEQDSIKDPVTGSFQEKDRISQDASRPTRAMDAKGIRSRDQLAASFQKGVQAERELPRRWTEKGTEGWREKGAKPGVTTSLDSLRS